MPGSKNIMNNIVVMITKNIALIYSRDGGGGGEFFVIDRFKFSFFDIIFFKATSVLINYLMC